MSEALRKLSEWIDSTDLADFGGKSGKCGKHIEKSGLFTYHQNFSSGKCGKQLTTLPLTQIPVVSENSNPFNALTTLTTLTTKNDDVLNAANVEPPSYPGLNYRRRLELAAWYEKQGCPDNDLLLILREEAPPRIEDEFEHIMDIVFAM